MAKTKQLFVDANVLLELLLPDRPKTSVCEAYLLKSHGTTMISALSLHIVHYFGKKQGYDVSEIDAFLANFEIVPVDHGVYVRAMQLLKDDGIEDAMQVAAALSADCDTFVTLDAALQQLYCQDIDIELL